MENKITKSTVGSAICLAAALGLANTANADTVDFTDNGTFIVPSLTEGQVTVSGSNDLTVLNTNGIGIYGGADATLVDPGETISFSFDSAVDGVFIDTYQTVDLGSDGIFLEISLTAYDDDGLLITSTTHTVDPSQAIDVTGVLGINSLSSFDLDVIQQDGLLIGTISFQEAGGAPEYACGNFDNPLIEDNPATADVEQLAIKKKSKRTIPVKVQLFDASGNVVTDADVAPGSEPVINVTFNSSAGGASEVIDDSLLSNSKADDGNQFSYDAENLSWQFNLGTKNLSSSGTYTLSVVSGDEGAYSVNQPTCNVSFERK